MEIDTSRLKIADRLSGTAIHGYAGYYGRCTSNGRDAMMIVIPHDSVSVERIMQEIDLKV